MYGLIKPLLFKLDPEKSHHLTFGLLDKAYQFGLLKMLARKKSSKPVNVMGLAFNNPVGLAAGLDKNAEHVDALAVLGFGFVEVGTVTPKPQEGNPTPRLFRLTDEEAIINRMGFNNKGLDFLVEQVKNRKENVVLGINIGKNKVTPNEEAVNDYLACMDAVYSLADYITVNLSSPNTPGLRDLQFGEPLRDLLKALKDKQAALQEKYQRYVPLALKVAPDMADEDIADVADALLSFNIDGLIATNTTITRPVKTDSPVKHEAGGLSGKPVRELSTEVIRKFSQHLKSEIPIIAVGGIDSVEAAQEKINAGASLVQVYSGLIYQGPSLIGQISEGLKLNK